MELSYPICCVEAMEDKPKTNLKGRFVKGHKPTDLMRKKISLAQIGKKLSEHHKNKLRLAKLGLKGPETNRWIGDKVKDSGLHKWVRKHFPPPKECEFCKQDKPLQLANITGIYNRDFSNYKYLCAKCHVYLDGTVNNLIHKNMMPTSD